MNNIDYNQSGGFPLSTQILDAAQQAYKNFNAFGNLAGELAIIDGCVDASGGTVTNGFVSIYGELLPFLGTTKTTNVIIVETPDQRGFEDGSVKSVIYARYATFGDAVVSYPWANFRRPKTLFQLEDELIQLRKATPIGLVAVWGNFIDAIPEGWAAWDIAKGCVIVSRNEGDINFGAALGTKIGTAQVTLDISQIPAHSHGVTAYKTTENKVPNTGSGANGADQSLTTSSAGGGQAHTNIQPTLIADHMIFVGFN
jgi:hypothetical protein